MPRTRQQKYQEGSIDLVHRVKGPDVWVYRWRESAHDGSRSQRKRTIGDVTQFPTRSAAKRVLENLRAEINAAQEKLGQMTVVELWGHFQANELHDPHVDRSPTTIGLYLENFSRYIIPRWGTTYLHDVKAVAVEKWLRSLPYADTTKSKLRNQMSAIFSHAIRHELWDKLNPISSVRQSAKRQADPVILSLAEMRAILRELPSVMHRTIVLLAAVSGLRRSEISGLKWENIDFTNLWITPRLGVVRAKLTKLKTAASRRGIPMPPGMATALMHWREASLYRAEGDWVFASVHTAGKTPIWLDMVLADYVKPAAVRAGISKNIGFHTFRHSLATLLAAKKENVKVVQELLRHANVSVTLELYQQGDVDAKRMAQGHTSELFLD